MSSRLRTAVAAVAAALVLGSATAVAPAAAAAVTVVGVTVVPSAVDPVTGFASVSVELSLESPDPLPDTLGPAMPFETATVFAEVVGARPAAVGEGPPSVLAWGELTRVSGTATDGVWRATTAATRWWTGEWRVVSVQASEGVVDPDLDRFDARVVVGTTAAPPWQVAAAPVGPVKVVTGREPWTPRLRVTDRATGLPVVAFVGAPDSPFDSFAPAARLPAGSQLGRTDRAGYHAVAPRGVLDDEGTTVAIPVYGGRGSRGFSLEGMSCLAPWVKWQANERFTTSGRTVTASGNAWPAPSIYPAANPAVHLQAFQGGAWQTVASGTVRANGRYDVVWTAPTAGARQLRVYKPGGVAGCRISAGSVLPAVGVTVP